MALEDAQLTFSLPQELHPFVRLVLNEPQLQARLAVIAEMREFVSEAVKVAEENGLALNPEVMSDFLRPDPVGIGRFGSAPIEIDTWPPIGWLPTRSVPTDGSPAFDWLWFGDRRLTLPFLEDEVRRAAAMPFNWFFRIRTSMAALIKGAGKEAELPLHGLIYHMSRCGSTLLAQMLAAVPENAVSSEPEPLDGVIQWVRLSNIGEDTAIPAIRAIVAALGRDRANGNQRHLIKLDAWHSFSLPLIRAAFPDVNWVYLYRDATEVMVSTMQQPGAHTAPGVLPEQVIGFAVDGSMTLEDFAARVLARIGETIVAHWELGGGMVVAYPDIVEAAPVDIADHFALVIDANSLALMTAAAKRDAKDPQEQFASDVARKHAAATAAVEASVAKWMQPVELELALLSRGAKNMANNGAELSSID